MKKILLYTLIIILIIIVTQCQSSDFISNFWSNLFAGLIIAILFGAFLDQFTQVTKKPILTMVVKQGKNYDEEIFLTKLSSGEYECSFRIAIKNSGKKMLMPGEGYWHIYFPSLIKIETSENAAGFLSSDIDHLRDLISLPVFPDSFLDVGPEFKIKIPNDGLASFKVYYFLSTNYGYFPKSVVLNQKTGLVDYNSMSEIKINVV